MEKRRMDRDLLASAMSGKMRSGKNDLIKHLKGERLTQRHAIAAKCYDCDGMGETGVCDLGDCALYPYSPFQLGSGKQKGVSGGRS